MGLKIDWDAAEGAATLPSRLARENCLFRADVIGDWIGDLEVLRAEALAEFLSSPALKATTAAD